MLPLPTGNQTMLTNDIALLAGHPERLSRSTLYMLRTAVARYPWFETARLLLLNNLYLLHDPDFGKELRASVLYVHDRRTLCRLIDTLSQSVTETALYDASEEEDAEPSMDRTMSLINAFLETLPDMPQVLIPDNPVSTDYMAFFEQSNDAVSEEKTVPATTVIPLHDGVVTPDEIKTVIPPQSEPEKTVSEDVHSEPDKKSNNETSYETVKPSFFTETLARIYIRQKKYDRALEIIRSLYLNYPEKNIYFADQIRFLERLVKNNNLKNK